MSTTKIPSRLLASKGGSIYEHPYPTLQALIAQTKVGLIDAWLQYYKTPRGTWNVKLYYPALGVHGVYLGCFYKSTNEGVWKLKYLPRPTLYFTSPVRRESDPSAPREFITTRIADTLGLVEKNQYSWQSDFAVVTLVTPLQQTLENSHD